VFVPVLVSLNSTVIILVLLDSTEILGVHVLLDSTVIFGLLVLLDLTVIFGVIVFQDFMVIFQDIISFNFQHFFHRPHQTAQSLVMGLWTRNPGEKPEFFATRTRKLKPDQYSKPDIQNPKTWGFSRFQNFSLNNPYFTPEIPKLFWKFWHEKKYFSIQNYFFFQKYFNLYEVWKILLQMQ